MKQLRVRHLKREWRGRWGNIVWFASCSCDFGSRSSFWGRDEVSGVPARLRRMHKFHGLSLFLATRTPSLTHTSLEMCDLFEKISFHAPRRRQKQQHRTSRNKKKTNLPRSFWYAAAALSFALMEFGRACMWLCVEKKFALKLTPRLHLRESDWARLLGRWHPTQFWCFYSPRCLFAIRNI